MKEQKFYICEHCHTQYSDKNKCRQCESNHKVKLSIGECRYVSYNNDNSGFPTSIVIVADEKGTKRTYR